MDERTEIGCAIAVIVGLILLAIGLGLFQCYQEARAYNRLTGATVTMWDAMWTELRVTGNAKGAE